MREFEKSRGTDARQWAIYQFEVGASLDDCRARGLLPYPRDMSSFKDGWLGRQELFRRICLIGRNGLPGFLVVSP